MDEAEQQFGFEEIFVDDGLEDEDEDVECEDEDIDYNFDEDSESIDEEDDEDLSDEIIDGCEQNFEFEDIDFSSFGEE